MKPKTDVSAKPSIKHTKNIKNLFMTYKDILLEMAYRRQQSLFGEYEKKYRLP